jgi:hypothetical protein
VHDAGNIQRRSISIPITGHNRMVQLGVADNATADIVGDRRKTEKSIASYATARPGRIAANRALNNR